MKQLAILLFMCLFAVSCIDNEYDLSNVDTSEESGVVIGNNESEFKMPLATINFSVESFNQSKQDGEISITELVNEVNVWLPSTLPGGVDYIEIGRVMSDSDYLNSILAALIDEMNADAAKRDEVCLLIAKEYRNDILSILDGLIPQYILSSIYDLTDEQAAEAISDLYVVFNDVLSLAIKTISSDFLLGLHIDNIEFQIPGLGVSSEVYDMLVKNLDSPDMPNPVNAIYLYGTIESQLPVTFTIYPRLQGLTVDFGQIAVVEGLNSINDVRVNANDLYTLLLGYGANFIISVELDRYYVNRKISDDQQVNINLKLRKTGGLKL